MASVNDFLQDEAIRHATELQKYGNSVLAKIMAVLNRSDARLAAELAALLSEMSPSGFSMDRLEALLSSIRAMNTQAYNQAERELTEELKQFVAYEVAYQQQMLTSFLPVGVSVASVNVAQVYAAAMARPFQGSLLRQVWSDLDAAKMKRVRQVIAQGFVEGKTTDQIIREMRGAKAKGYADGFIQKDRRDVAAVVRTALSHTAGSVHDAVYERNSDVIKALKWSATLDLRTSPMCRIRDGKLYTPDSHKPINHKIPWGGGPGRLHWCCRSASVPVLKSNKELGIDLPDLELSDRTRASMDGQIPADTTFSDWIKRQSASRQDEVLGLTRGKLLRDGGLSLDDMYTDKGTYLTLEQLRQRDAKAFERAGV